MNESELKAYDSHVTLCPDGKYRWIYEVNLFKNASTFYDVVKVIGLTLGLVYGMMLIMGIFVADDWSVVWTMTLAFFCIALGLCLLCLIIYWIWAAANGGRYAALFEMDEQASPTARCRSTSDSSRLSAVSGSPWDWPQVNPASSATPCWPPASTSGSPISPRCVR